MQLCNNLYRYFGRTGPAKQMLLPGQLNKAEGTVPYIGSDFAPIPPLHFFSVFCPAPVLSASADCCTLLCAAA